MTAGIALRDYRADDLEALYALDVVCFEPQFRFSKTAMKKFAEASNALVVIAEAGDALAGFGIVHVELGNGGRLGYVVTLDVAPGQRRKGVARGLMQRMESHALATGCTAMALHVFPGNEGAVEFYEQLGYTLSHTARNFYGRGHDALVYRKALRPGAVEGGEWRAFLA